MLDEIAEHEAALSDYEETLEPVYIHDCPECEFFGTSQGMDMYICLKFGTKIVRYGDEGSDYVSGTNYTFNELLRMA